MNKNILAILFFATSICISAQSNHKIDSLKIAVQLTKQDTNQVKILDQIAGEYGIIMEYDTAYQYAKIGLKLARKLKYNKGIVIHLKNLCDYYVRNQNQSKALEVIFEAYKITQEEDLVFESLQVLAGISNTYVSFNNYKEAIKYKFKELKKRESLINNPVYRKNNAEKLNGDSIRVSTALANLSHYYLKINQIDSGVFYGKKALNYTNIIQKKDPINLAYIHNGLGIAYHQAGKSDSAMVLFRKSIEQAQLSKKKRNKLNVLESSYWEIAILFRDTRQIDSSNYYAELALTICQQIKWYKDALEIQLLLAKNYSGIDNTKAVFYYQQSFILRDSLYNKEKTEQLQNLTSNEKERQEEFEIQRKLEEEKRRKQLNYTIIGVSILLFIIVFIALSRSIITSEKLNAFLSTIAVMMTFKFSNMLLDPFVEFKISDNPSISFFTAIATAAALSPVQKYIRKWLKAKMLAKAKAKKPLKVKKKKKVVKKGETNIDNIEQAETNIESNDIE